MARADEKLGGSPERVAGDAPSLTAGLSIARAARAVGLSRTTLMYYERLGLIRPMRRTGSRYRTFRPNDLQTLFLIARWRAIGLPLATITRLLADRQEVQGALRDHVRSLEKSIAAMQGQRRLTLEMLGSSTSGPAGTVTKAAWSEMFRSIGMSDEQMRQWHAEFERRNGAGHVAFLRSLGIGRAEIGRIRRWCPTTR
jgi:DNA-binding transcriptional MerR regulator